MPFRVPRSGTVPVRLGDTPELLAQGDEDFRPIPARTEPGTICVCQNQVSMAIFLALNRLDVGDVRECGLKCSSQPRKAAGVFRRLSTTQGKFDPSGRNVMPTPGGLGCRIARPLRRASEPLLPIIAETTCSPGSCLHPPGHWRGLTYLDQAGTTAFTTSCPPCSSCRCRRVSS